MRFTGSTLRALAIASVIAAIAAACAGQAAGGDGAGATIRLASPGDGATVSVPFDVRIEASVPLGAPETGNHHAHLYFDTTTDAGDYDIVYGNSATVSRPLTPGQHTIIVALANPDHSLAGPTQQLTVTVAPAAAPTDGPGEDASPTPVVPPAPTSPTIDY